jgi:hypothetical protein
MTPYKGRFLDPTRPVRVYRNLHSSYGDGRRWSIRQGPHVVAHADNLHLVDVRFVVSEKGRQRVLAERRKNVHAFAEGRVIDFDGLLTAIIWSEHTFVRVGYYPALAPKFAIDDGPFAGLIIESAPTLILRRYGYALIPKKSLPPAACNSPESPAN